MPHTPHTTHVTRRHARNEWMVDARVCLRTPQSSEMLVLVRDRERVREGFIMSQLPYTLYPTLSAARKVHARQAGVSRRDRKTRAREERRDAHLQIHLQIDFTIRSTH